jgi:hypothetical protein
MLTEEGAEVAKFGFSERTWEKAKVEAIEILIDVARREETISYSDLAKRIHAISIEPHDYAMRTFLGEISTDEHGRNRGMLSAVVVYKNGDQMPGPGFFDLAKDLGNRFRDETEFWIKELQRVYKAHKTGKS